MPFHWLLCYEPFCHIDWSTAGFTVLMVGAYLNILQHVLHFMRTCIKFRGISTSVIITERRPSSIKLTNIFPNLLLRVIHHLKGRIQFTKTETGVQFSVSKTIFLQVQSHLHKVPFHVEQGILSSLELASTLSQLQFIPSKLCHKNH